MISSKGKTAAGLKWILAALLISIILTEGVYRFMPVSTVEHLYSDLWDRMNGVQYILGDIARYH